jgi:adenylate cyclase, class 2
MNQNNQETEVKLYTPELGPIRERLEAIGAALTVPRVYEYNVRYDLPDMRLTNNAIVLRLRRDNRIRLTYKGPQQLIRGVGVREELEVDVSDFEVMEKILHRLGYTVGMAYEKYRTTYELGGAEVVLDEMPFGNFVEIEGDFASINTALTQLELQDAERMARNYSGLFRNVVMNLGLTFRDLTFANFEGLTITRDDFNEPA